MPDAPITPATDPAPDVPKASWIWLKDSAGFPSVTVTFVTVSFWVTTALYILSAVGSIGPVTFRPFDVAAASAYFIPVLTLYFGRKFTDAKFVSATQSAANTGLVLAATKLPVGKATYNAAPIPSREPQ